MRLIDADALFSWGDKKLSDAVKYGNKDSVQQHWSYSTLKMYEVAAEIDNAPTIPTWIKCSDQLPEPGERVLMLIDGVSVYEGWYQTGGWRRHNSGIPAEEWLGKVTHWMPLPEPPKGDLK